MQRVWDCASELVLSVHLLQIGGSWWWQPLARYYAQSHLLCWWVLRQKADLCWAIYEVPLKVILESNIQAHSHTVTSPNPKAQKATLELAKNSHQCGPVIKRAWSSRRTWHSDSPGDSQFCIQAQKWLSLHLKCRLTFELSSGSVLMTLPQQSKITAFRNKKHNKQMNGSQEEQRYPELIVLSS